MKRLFQREITRWQLLVAVVGLSIVLGTGGAVAGSLITGKDIKNNSIAAKDLKKKIRAKLDRAGTVGAPGQQGAAGPQGATGAAGTDAVVRVTNLAPDTTGDGVTPPAWGERISSGCGSGNGDAAVTGENLVFTTPEESDAVGVNFNGYNGLKLEDISYISYHAKYEQEGTDQQGGTPYFRIYTENFDHAVIFSPNTQPGATIREGEWQMFVPTEGTVRYDDDAGNNPDITWDQLIADHGDDVINQIRIQAGCAGAYSDGVTGSADNLTMVVAGTKSVFDFGN